MKMKYFGFAALVSVLGLAPWSANADSFWQSSTGAPLKSSGGACVNASLAHHDVAACKLPDRVILLPDADGKAGAVLISSQGTTQRLDQAYNTISASTQGLAKEKLSAQQVDSEFGLLLDTQPLAVKSFTVRFVSGSATELTPDSTAVFAQLKAEIQKRNAPEVRLVGHTDSVGDLLKNDLLSKLRAETVADTLVTFGIALDNIEATGRGEREPAVTTGNNVSEAANRRVDIKVR